MHFFSFFLAFNTNVNPIRVPDYEMPAFVFQKQVEEERQARVGQVSDLLGWVKSLQERAAGPAETSLAAQQV